jgi:hypothetical protein
MAKLAKVKTTQNTASVEEFLNALADEQQRRDSFLILEMMKKATGEEPMMWGTSLIGFGKVRIKSPSGREVEWFLLGFSPRKANLSLYLSTTVLKQEEELKKLGKCKTGMGCLYINKLGDVDIKVLKGMINDSLKK